jgi:molybdate transport system substrate-binding protein
MRILYHAVCMTALLASTSTTWADTLRVAVAANFAATARSLGTAFEARSGHQLDFSVASTGVLVGQILHGAPFDVFLSADADGPATLASSGQADGASRFCYAAGKLVLVGGSLEDLERPDLGLAVANPVTAPYGRAAFEVLARDPFNQVTDRRLLRGSNVLQAFQFWSSGGADLALVAASIAGDAGVEIPVDWHAPIEQHAILLSSGQNRPAAAEFLAFLQSIDAVSTIAAEGYRTCS